MEYAGRPVSTSMVHDCEFIDEGKGARSRVVDGWAVDTKPMRQGDG